MVGGLAEWQTGIARGQRPAKTQAAGGAVRSGHVARDHRQAPGRLGDAGGIAFEERAGVGVAGAVEDVAHLALLDDLAGIHHDDVVAELGDQAEIVRDDDDGRVQLLLQLAASAG